MVANTETLSPGNDATVSSTFDTENDIVYFSFGIPQGVKGDIGDTLFTTFNVLDGKLMAYYSRENEPYEFRLNGNKLEVVFDE